MYPLNFDYLDGFSVLVGDDFVIVGGQSASLGSYAADALNVEAEYVRQLIGLARTARFAFDRYAAARDAENRAALNRAIGEALLSAYRLLPYRRLFEGGKSTRIVMSYSEDVSAAAFTEGTEEHAAVTEWLDRLCDLPHAIERFQRHAHEFLDEFLPDDVARRASSYAEAYQRYWMREQLTAFALEDEVYERSGSDFFRARGAAREEQSYRSFPSSFPISVSYRTTTNPKNPHELMMVEELSFHDWETFVSLDLFRGLAAGHIPRRCQNCGKYFLLDSGHDIRYCGNLAPDGKGKTCRQIGAHRKERAANGADTIRGAYATVYNRVKTQKNRKKITVDDYNRKIAQAQELRDKAEAGELTLKEFKALLDKI